MRIVLVLCVVSLVVALSGHAAERIDVSVDDAPRITADSAVVIDVDTGIVLYAKDAWRRRPPASLTKMMTALVAVETVGLTELVTVSSSAAYTGGSSMEIDRGEVYTIGDLLAGLLLESGNDAAVAIAEHVSGSVYAFAEVMTARAWVAGANRSIFSNPHGLTDIAHLSTAYDMALIGRQAITIPIINRLVATEEMIVFEQTEGRPLLLKNTNRLLFEDERIRGMKTGTTPPAGKCLMIKAHDGRHAVIAVVLHSDDRYGDSQRLVRYVLDHMRYVDVVSAGDVVNYVPVLEGRSSNVPIEVLGSIRYPVVGDGDIRINIDVQSPLIAPLRQGDPVGLITVSGPGGELIGQLVVGESVARRGFLRWR